MKYRLTEKPKVLYKSQESLQMSLQNELIY